MKIKICGIKNLDEARMVASLDIREPGCENLGEINGDKNLDFENFSVDFLGVIFAKSTRQVTINTAKKIAEIAHENSKKCVGVFSGREMVGENPNSRGANKSGINKIEAEILEIFDYAKLDIVQIYAPISQIFKDKINQKGGEIWRVISIKDEIPSLENEIFDKILFDYKGANLGGNGLSFDFSLLENFSSASFIIAGGIGAHNAKLAATLKPYALDINSKVEDENQIKSRAKIFALLKSLKS